MDKLNQLHKLSTGSAETKQVSWSLRSWEESAGGNLEYVRRPRVGTVETTGSENGALKTTVIWPFCR